MNKGDVMTADTQKRIGLPRPFLKWAGGKRSLLPELMERVELAGKFRRYHEPFLGGGALFFRLYREGRLKRQAWLSDANRSLMETWGGVREQCDDVVSDLHIHVMRHAQDDRAQYYFMRDRYPAEYWNIAARIIYLNKTCFNGLYRENLKGKFNTPIGKYKNPTICDEENLRAVSEALRKKAKLFCGHFAEVLDRAEKGDLVYFDPPFAPTSETSFTTYHAGGFGRGAHQILADVAWRLDAKGVKVLLSNSDTDFVRDLYAQFTIEEVKGRRSISCKGEGRGKARDLLIRNF